MDDRVIGQEESLPKYNITWSIVGLNGKIKSVIKQKQKQLIVFVWAEAGKINKQKVKSKH